MITWRTVLATAAGVVAALVLALVAVTWCWNRGACPGNAHGPDDANLRKLVTLLLAGSPDGRLPMKHGELDLCRLVKNGTIRGADLMILLSAYTGTSPTPEEIVRNDYTNFRWERYRGDGRLEGAPFPLLWEKKPDKHGGGLVAFSDGSVKYVEELDAVIRQPR